MVLVERTGCRHSPGGQRGVVGERGEEGFQLEVRAKWVCGPLCGDATKTLLRVSEMVVRRHGRRGFGLAACPYVTIITWARQMPAKSGPVCPLRASQPCPREHSFRAADD